MSKLPMAQNDLDIKVSVIIPIHNTRDYLGFCLDSILRQSLSEIEIICVDDGSTDGSADILASYAKQDDRIVVLTQQCKGAGPARNLGISYARGQFIDFVDSDDFLESDTLKLRYERAAETNADIVISGFKRYDAQRKELCRRIVFGWAVNALPCVFAPRQFADSLFTSFMPAPWNKFFRAEFITRHQLQFQSLARCNDVCFTMTALATADRLTVLDEAGYVYRDGRTGSAQNTSEQNPICVCRAYWALRDNLRIKGLYSQFRKSFCKATFSSCMATLALLKDFCKGKEFYNILHMKPFSDLFADKLHEKDFGEDVVDYRRYAVFSANEPFAKFLMVECESIRERIKQYVRTIDVRTEKLVGANQLIAAKDRRIDDLEARVKKWTHETVVRNQLIAAKDARIDDLERRVKKWTHETVVRNQLIVAKDARIDDLEARVKKWTHETVVRNQLIAAKDARIDEYIRHLAELQNSWAYRLGRMLTWPTRKLRSLIGG